MTRPSRRRLSPASTALPWQAGCYRERLLTNESSRRSFATSGSGNGERRDEFRHGRCSFFRWSLHTPASFRRRLVGFHRWTRTDEMAVAVEIIYPVHRRPILVAQQRLHRKTGERARIGPIPGFIDKIGNGVRRVLEHVVFGVHRLLLNGGDLRPK